MLQTSIYSISNIVEWIKEYDKDIEKWLERTCRRFQGLFESEKIVITFLDISIL